MTEKKQFRAVKGTRDILPPDSALWNWFEAKAREVFESYNFREIRLPIFEDTSLFARSIGEETDVVSKEMYTFEDYEFSELLEQRSFILTWQYSSSDRDSFYSFARRGGRFAELGKKAFAAGEMPKSPENSRVLQMIEDQSTSFASLADQDHRQIDAAASQIKNSVRGLKLGDSLTLRPEATASTMRAYIEHNMQALPGNVKLYCIGPMFRRERPRRAATASSTR